MPTSGLGALQEPTLLQQPGNLFVLSEGGVDNVSDGRLHPASFACHAPLSRLETQALLKEFLVSPTVNEVFLDELLYAGHRGQVVGRALIDHDLLDLVCRHLSLAEIDQSLVCL